MERCCLKALTKCPDLKSDSLGLGDMINERMKRNEGSMGADILHGYRKFSIVKILKPHANTDIFHTLLI